jgi:lipopolysaccharide transport system ATP-binding protein
MAFQQKCVGRMRQMREDGLTLLFVSHSSDTVKSVCDKGLFLIDGQTAYWGPAGQAVNNYYNYTREITNREATQTQKDLLKHVRFENRLEGVMRYGTGHVQLQKVELYNAAGEPSRAFGFDEQVVLEATVKAYIDTENLSVSFLVRDMTGIDLMGSTTFDEGVELPAMAKGEQLAVRMSFRNVLHWGNYGISIAVHRVKNRDYSDNVLFDQVDGGLAFASLQNHNRPIHYKFHNRIDMEWRRI